MKIPALAAGAAVLLTAALLTLGPAAPDATAPADAATATGPAVQRTTTGVTGETVELRLRRAVTKLPVAAERRRGYDRDQFRHWVDANDDCQDTREEVLAAESATEVSGCDIGTGEWNSYYDGEVWTDSSDVDIDHLAPLAEPWASGARKWTAGTRTRYANDLPDPRPLVAVTDKSQPVQVRPGPGPVAAGTRQVPVPAGVGGGEDPMEADGEPAGEAGAARPGRQL